MFSKDLMLILSRGKTINPNRKDQRILIEKKASTISLLKNTRIIGINLTLRHKNPKRTMS